VRRIQAIPRAIEAKDESLHEPLSAREQIADLQLAHRGVDTADHGANHVPAPLIAEVHAADVKTATNRPHRTAKR